jgi:DDE superfamily endonuclease
MLRLPVLRQWMDDLPGNYFLIDDNAFTLSNKMLVPFSGAQRSHQYKDVYNYYLSQLRIRIEMAFGLLTTKWRIFRKPLDVSLVKATKIIQVCMILHNFVIENDAVSSCNSESEDAVDGETTDCNQLLAAILPQVDLHRNDALRRNHILEEVTEREMTRPQHNITRRMFEP